MGKEIFSISAKKKKNLINLSTDTDKSLPLHPYYIKIKISQ